MAAVWIFRLAIKLAPAGEPTLRWVQSHDVDQPWRIGKSVVERLHDPGESDAALSEAVSASSGIVSSVATFSAPFELRKFQVIFSHQDQAVATDDARIFTIHCIKLAAGTPTDSWVQADFDAFVAALNTFWTALKPNYVNEVVLDRLKVYKDGPAIEPPQVPVYDLELNTPGTSTADCMPPQVAVTVTEQAGSKLHWGRFYLPAPAVTTGNTFARIGTVFQTLVADQADIFYQALKTANIPAVVYRRELPEREKKSGAILPARDASAWTVDRLQVDDVFDVIRSRRWKYPLTRIGRDIT